MEEELRYYLKEHSDIVEEILRKLDEPAASMERVPWADVVKAAEQVSKQATTAGIVWCEHMPVASGKQNIKAFSDSLQLFLLLCHGSTVGAGTTLLKFVHVSAKQVVDSSFTLLSKAISLNAKSHAAERKAIIPQLTGCVWDACNAVKRTPTSNATAIGRSLVQIATSVKDVVRELQELKEENNSSEDQSTNKMPEDDAESIDDLDIDQNLSTKEMEIAKSLEKLILSVLDVLKELIYFYGNIAKCPTDTDAINLFSLERILSLCQEMSVQLDELGASCYPLQENEQMKISTKKICNYIDDIEGELQKISNSYESFMSAKREFEKSKVSLLGTLELDG